MSDTTSEEFLFSKALEKGSEAERTSFLDSACRGDAHVRRRVDRLLRAHSRIGFFLNSPAIDQFVLPPKGLDSTRALSDSVDEQSNDACSLDFLQPPSRPDSIGRIGHYEVLEVLGRGGFGIVFRAIDERLQRMVAVKVLSPQLAATPSARRRFVAEARSYARIRHGNVVQVYSVEEQSLPFLVMEFVPGETLQQRLKRTGPLDLADVVRIGRQVAEGLAATHARGLIHRDVKPENILLESSSGNHSGEVYVKISDFGLARAADDDSMTHNGLVAGTPMFMSPEQAMGETLDYRADLFSLGSVLYTMCCGHAPFRGMNTFEILRRVVEDTPQSIRDVIPETPEWLCELITRLHAKDRGDRFESARDVAELFAHRMARMPHSSKLPAHLDAATTAQEATPATGLPQSSRLVRGRIGGWAGRRWAAAWAIPLILFGVVGLTEATSVSDLRSTIVRLFSPEGTLVVEVDDPGVSIQIDGAELVITGTGAREIRLRPGKYTLEARKDGKLVSRELVSVANNGRRIVRVSQEPLPDAKDAQPSPESLAWELAVAAMPASDQLPAVIKRLKELNPGFDGLYQDKTAYFDMMIRGGELRDISPVRAVPGLASLFVNAEQLSDLAPLQGLKLSQLALDCPRVSDLSALEGMNLIELNLAGSVSVADLAPLKGAPLEALTIAFTQVSDLSPLMDMKLKYLNCDSSKVSDLSPLRGMRLTGLEIHNTQVSDLTVLEGMPLVSLNCDNTRVTDADLVAIEDCKSLAYLRLSGTEVTAAGIHELQKALPDCRIKWDGSAVEAK